MTKDKMMTDKRSLKEPLEKYTLKLRALVLALGETAEPPWWKTEFMSKTGLSFLERLYPRTPIRAAVHASGKAACEEHDKAVGRVGVYHLFRLPDSLESEIHDLSTFGDQEFINNFRSCIDRRNGLIEMLSALCSKNKKKGKHSVGPKRIGDVWKATKVEALKDVASAYRAAFEQGQPVFPYFASKKNKTGG
jgi:hypothetical protein